MNELVVVGASHRASHVALRERLALSPRQATSVLGDLVAQHPINEALALSTCGRTELYALSADAAAAEVVLMQTLARRAGVAPEALAGETEVAHGRDALHHLFRVAAGLESMVLGEVEILGQLRSARDRAQAAGAVSLTMKRLVDCALAAGRLVREQTGIAAGRASIGSVAVGLARSLLGDAAGTAIVIGSGEVGATTAQALARAGIDVTIAAGRRPERARRLAAEVGGRAVAAGASLLEPLAAADVVVACTASPHAVVPFELLADAMERRATRTLLVFDLALPRDVDPAARTLRGVQLYDVDDLTSAASSAADARAAAVPAATAIVDSEAERCADWMRGLSVAPTIKRLHVTTYKTVLEALRRSDLAAAVDDCVLRATSTAIVRRLLHDPTLRVREAALLGDGERLAAAARELFALDGERAA
jgi:glutamyl-tRNA reductase